MSGGGEFDAAWLGLREPFDHAARSETLAATLAAALPPAPRLIDLGGGTGGNLRYLAERLRGRQEWLLIDHDAGLLDVAPTAMRRLAGARGWTVREEEGGALRLDAPAGPVRLRRRRMDLARELDVLPFGEADAVTASALLDLTSEAWLETLAERSAAAGLPLLMALSYDGRMSWRPEDDGDARVQAAFDCHQRRDKGFGPALGPGATLRFAAALRARGFAVRLERSDWQIGADDRAMLAAMLAGISGAAREAMPDEAGAIEAWLTRRRATLDQGRLELQVGHLDLLALPPPSA